MTPAFEAAYAVAPEPPLVAMRLDTLMMQPLDISLCRDPSVLHAL